MVHCAIAFATTTFHLDVCRCENVNSTIEISGTHLLVIGDVTVSVAIAQWERSLIITHRSICYFRELRIMVCVIHLTMTSCVRHQDKGGGDRRAKCPLLLRPLNRCK